MNYLGEHILIVELREVQQRLYVFLSVLSVRNLLNPL